MDAALSSHRELKVELLLHNHQILSCSLPQVESSSARVLLAGQPVYRSQTPTPWGNPPYSHCKHLQRLQLNTSLGWHQANRGRQSFKGSDSEMLFMEEWQSHLLGFHEFQEYSFVRESLYCQTTWKAFLASKQTCFSPVLSIHGDFFFALYVYQCKLCKAVTLVLTSVFIRTYCLLQHCVCLIPCIFLKHARNCMEQKVLLWKEYENRNY